MPSTDLNDRPVIIGAGLAGLMTALQMAPCPAVMLSPFPLGTEASSAWAQGGVAASVGIDDDASLHLKDTLLAGDGLCDEDVARRILDRAGDEMKSFVRLSLDTEDRQSVEHAYLQG